MWQKFAQNLVTLIAFHRWQHVLISAVNQRDVLSISFRSDFDQSLEDFQVQSRVARFFSIHDTKTGKMYQMNTKCTEWSLNISNLHKIFQMAIKYINIFQSKTLQNLPKLGFWFENKPSGNPGPINDN
jgi:hypothetical protein